MCFPFPKNFLQCCSIIATLEPFCCAILHNQNSFVPISFSSSMPLMFNSNFKPSQPPLTSCSSAIPGSPVPMSFKGLLLSNTRPLWVILHIGDSSSVEK